MLDALQYVGFSTKYFDAPHDEKTHRENHPAGQPYIQPLPLSQFFPSYPAAQEQL